MNYCHWPVKARRALFVISCILVTVSLWIVVIPDLDLQLPTRFSEQSQLARRVDQPVPEAPCTKVTSEQCCESYADFIQPVNTLRPAPRRTRDDRRCLQILLVVIFNSPLYDHEPFLRLLYGSFFPSIVFYGPTESAERNILGVKKTPGFLGDFQHFAIAQATVEFPGYDGYLWVADDLLFNFKKVVPLMDPSKLWMVYGYHGHGASPNILDNRTDWEHWARSDGLPAVRLLYACIPNIYTESSGRWFGGANRVTFSVGDFGYIPKRFVEDFRVLSYSLRTVFMEITIPTAFFLMSRTKDDIQAVTERAEAEANFLWAKERKSALDKLSSQSVFVHPFKLHHNQSLQWLVLEKVESVWNWRATDSPRVHWLHCTP